MASAHRPHAAAVQLGGQPVELDLLLPGASRLSGVVRVAGTGTPGTGRAGTGTAGTGRALPGATVTLADARGEVVASQRTGTDGRYVIEDLTPGRYTLALSAPSCQPAAIGVTVADRAETTQDAELRSGATVMGTARTAAGAAIPDTRVMLLDADGNVAAVSGTGPAGTYSFENLPEGDYTVIASGYPPAASRLRVSSGEPHTHDVQLGHPEGITD